MEAEASVISTLNGMPVHNNTHTHTHTPSVCLSLSVSLSLSLCLSLTAFSMAQSPTHAPSIQKPVANARKVSVTRLLRHPIQLLKDQLHVLPVLHQQNIRAVDNANVNRREKVKVPALVAAHAPATTAARVSR